MKINNVPDWARDKKYITARNVEGDWWFYDSWNDFEEALNQAIEIGGQIIPACLVESAEH